MYRQIRISHFLNEPGIREDVHLLKKYFWNRDDYMFMIFLNISDPLRTNLANRTYRE